MADMKKRFLDYAGLASFWSIIDTKFATKAESANYGSFKFQNKADDVINTVQMQYDNCLPEGSGKESKVIELPKASRTQAGTMSADHFSIIQDLQANIESMAPFAGLDIEGDEVSLKTRRANIGLKYVVDGSIEEDNRTAKIQLLDLSYPTDGKWETSTKEEYDANHEANPGKYIDYKTYTGTGTSMVTNHSYYKWTGEGAGPVNSTGKPIEKHAISEIDVTELIRTGLLESTDVVIEGGKTKIKLGFIVHNNGVDSVEYQYIDVTDLVDIYTAGEGISITDNENKADDTARTGTIKVLAATDDTLGAIRTGYTSVDKDRNYAVKLTEATNDGKDGNDAFVNVPWKDVYVTGNSEGVNGEGKKYITVNVTETKDGNADAGKPNSNFNITVEAGEGLQRAESLAKSSIQSVTVGSIDENAATGLSKDDYIKTLTVDNTWGKNVTVELTDSAEASLGHADTAVQSIITQSANAATRPGAAGTTATDDLKVEKTTTGKGAGEYTISLGQKTIESLNLADTSIQKITMLGTELEYNVANPNEVVYTVNQAKDALKLGTSAYVNTSDVVPAEAGENDANLKSDVKSADGSTTLAADVYHVPTTKAVKTYVDSNITTLETNINTTIQNAIENLDSDIATQTTADVAHTYGPARMVWDNIVIRDGKLIGPDDENPDKDKGDTAVSTLRALSIADIADFRPLDTAEIYAICGLTPPAAN